MEAMSIRKSDTAFWSEFLTDVASNGTQYHSEPTHLDDYKICLVVAYCTLFVIGACGNAWVAFVIGRLLFDGSRNGGGMLDNNAFMPRKALAPAPRPIQIYIFALCCCDFIVLCFLLFLILDLVNGSWIAPSSTFLCQLYLCSESLNKFCGPFFLVALSGYCYVRVCKNQTCSANGTQANGQPLLGTNGTLSLFSWSRTLLKTRVCLMVIGICLCLVFILITPVYMFGDVHYLILYNNSTVFSITPKCAFQPAENILTLFTIYSFICGYVIPASLFTFFYASIMRRAFRHAKHRSESVVTLESSRRSPKTYLGRVVKTTLGLVLFYLVCWTPYWAMAIWQYTVPHDEQGQTTNAWVILGYLIHILPYVNCTGYPILYTVLNKSIKDSYRRVKLNKELKNSQLATMARQQSNPHPTLQLKISRCESRCNSFFFVENSTPASPNVRAKAL